MNSNHVTIIGGATYIGTALMKSLRAMTIHVTGNDFHYHNVQRYISEWQSQNTEFEINPKNITTTAEKVVFAAGSDYIMKNEVPTLFVRNYLNNLSSQTFLRAKKIFILMPFNKHDLGLTTSDLVRYFGKREEDIRLIQLSQLFKRYAQQIAKYNPHAQISHVYLSDIYGHKMPISPNHSLFYALTHNKPIQRQNIVESYFPTHINDVLNGLIKLLFNTEHYSHVALINEKAQTFIQTMPRSSHAKDWHLSRDYTINSSLLQYSKSTFPWAAKHTFRYQPKQKSPPATLSTPAIENVPKKKLNTSRYARIAQTALSLTIILTLGIIPVSKGIKDFKQLEKSLSSDQTQTSIQYAQATINNLENLMWLLTILQQREHAERTIQTLSYIGESALQQNTLHTLQGEGYQLLASYIDQKPRMSEIITWQQKVIMLMNELTIVSEQEIKNPHILGYMTRHTENMQQSLYELDHINELLNNITSEENSQFSIEIIYPDETRIYHVTSTPKGLLTNAATTTLPVHIQLNHRILSNVDFNGWLSQLSNDIRYNGRSTLQQLTTWYNDGHIRLIKNDYPCLSNSKALCVELNSLADIDIDIIDNQVTLTASNISPSITSLIISTNDMLKPSNIQDKYLRELETLKMSQVGYQKFIVYERPVDTGNTISISWYTQNTYDQVETFLPLNHVDLSTPTRLLHLVK